MNVAPQENQSSVLESNQNDIVFLVRQWDALSQNSLGWNFFDLIENKYKLSQTHKDLI